ncbi:MAG: hypothetical protein HUU35_13515, partial [Armatimonadetes bacterium]|nr:hypothetical protein [Armatimonadota bacterium]
MGRLALLLVCLGTAQAVVYVEAEALPYRGDWTLSSGEQNAHDDVLICTVEKNPRPAVGAVTIPRAGTYRLMVRARDFAHDRPGTRRFAVEVGGRRDAKEFGAHANPDPGAHGWAWEQGGVFELPAGPVVVALVAL